MRFKLLNFPIEIKPFFLLIMALIGHSFYRGQGIIGLLAWMSAATIAVLLHELGHGLWARWYGAKPEIELNGFGGVCKWQSYQPFTPKQDLVISLAGPLTGLILAGLSFGLLILTRNNPDSGFFLFAQASLACNLFWSLLNLLPVLPLDGGQAVRSTIKIFKGSHQEKLALQISYYFATAVAVASIIFLKGIIMPIFFGYFAYQNYRQYKALTRQGWA